MSWSVGKTVYDGHFRKVNSAARFSRKVANFSSVFGRKNHIARRKKKEERREKKEERRRKEKRKKERRKKKERKEKKEENIALWLSYRKRY